MSGDLFDFRADAQSVAEAENFVRTFSVMNATEAAIYAEIVMARYDALTAVAEAARAAHAWAVRSYGRSEAELGSVFLALGVALEALEGERC